MIGMNGLNAYYDQRGEAQHKYFDTSQPLMGVGGAGCGCANGMGDVYIPPPQGTPADVPPPAPSGVPTGVIVGGLVVAGLAVAWFVTRRLPSWYCRIHGARPL